MIPSFPKFKKLELEDREEIESFTRGFSPYAAYNFGAVWIWNTVAVVKISKLNENLVLRSYYRHLDKFTCYSFVGKTLLNKTVKVLIADAKARGIESALQFIPEEVVKQIENPQEFIIKEDRDKFEYILSIDEVVGLKGNKFRGIRKMVNRFMTNYGEQARFVQLDISNSETRCKILDLYNLWRKRGKTRKETEGGLKTLKRAMDYADVLLFKIYGLFIEDVLIGFTFIERTWGDHIIVQIEITDTSYDGGSYFLAQQVAIAMQKQGYRYINLMEDDGLPGLRENKEYWRPVKFFKKYTIDRQKK